MNAKLANLWDRLLSSLWFIPTLMAVLAVGLSFATISLDQQVRYEFLNRIGLVWAGGPDGAYALLSTVAGSMITVAGTVFSISIVALTLASSQFGPRLLRNFLRDTGNQVVLGTFIATFVYCLLVLRTIRSPEETLFVPYFSVTIGVLLAMTSIGVLIYYIHHVSVSIQAPQIVATVGRSLNQQVAQLYPRQLGRNEHPTEVRQRNEELPPAFDRDAVTFTGPASGYVTSLDNDRLMKLAAQHDLVIQLVHRPGDFVVRGATLGLVWPSEHVSLELKRDLADTFVMGLQRTPLQDVEFLFNELVEVAIRALSPAINDPFTAMASVDWLGAALCHLAQTEFPSPYRYDDQDNLRIVADPITFAEAVDTAFDQIREYGRTSTAVTLRLLDTLAIIAARTRTEDQRAALLRQAAMIERGSRTGLAEEMDRAKVQAYYQKLLRSLGVEKSP